MGCWRDAWCGCQAWRRFDGQFISVSQSPTFWTAAQRATCWALSGQTSSRGNVSTVASGLHNGDGVRSNSVAECSAPCAGHSNRLWRRSVALFHVSGRTTGGHGAGRGQSVGVQVLRPGARRCWLTEGRSCLVRCPRRGRPCVAVVLLFPVCGAYQQRSLCLCPGHCERQAEMRLRRTYGGMHPTRAFHIDGRHWPLVFAPHERRAPSCGDRSGPACATPSVSGASVRSSCASVDGPDGLFPGGLVSSHVGPCPGLVAADVSFQNRERRVDYSRRRGYR